MRHVKKLLRLNFFFFFSVAWHQTGRTAKRQRSWNVWTTLIFQSWGIVKACPREKSRSPSCSCRWRAGPASIRVCGSRLRGNRRRPTKTVFPIAVRRPSIRNRLTSIWAAATTWKPKDTSIRRSRPTNATCDPFFPPKREIPRNGQPARRAPMGVLLSQFPSVPRNVPVRGFFRFFFQFKFQIHPAQFLFLNFSFHSYQNPRTVNYCGKVIIMSYYSTRRLRHGNIVILIRQCNFICTLYTTVL